MATSYKKQADTSNSDATPAKTESELLRQSWRKSVGGRIDDVCGQIGSQMQAAIVAGVSVSTIQRYIRGEVDPSLEGMMRLAHQAGVSLDWLATGEGPMRSDAPSPTPGAGRAAAQTQHQGVTEGGAPPAFQAVPTGDASIKASVALAVTALGDHSQTIRPERLADLIDAAHQALQAGTDPALVRRLIAAAAQP